MTTEYLIKSPSEDKRCALRWPGLRPGETLAASLGWRVCGRDGADGLTLIEGETGARASAALASGGVAGGMYEVAQRVRTSWGREITGRLLLRVVAR